MLVSSRKMLVSSSVFFKLLALLALLALARADMMEQEEDTFDDEFGGNDNFDGGIQFRAGPAPPAGKGGEQGGADAKQQGGGQQKGQGGDKQCKLGTPCTNNADCGGKDGEKEGPQCFGALVGKCDCTACVTGIPCGDDSKCGGLEGACAIGEKPISQAKQRANAAAGAKAPQEGKCACLQMAQRKLNETQFPAGQTKPTLAQAINDFCMKANSPTCSSSACFGLPCHKGFCSNCSPPAAKGPAKQNAKAPAKAPAPGAQAAPAPATGGDDTAATGDN